MFAIRLRRRSAGSYLYDHPRVGVSTYYLIERGWSDMPGTDRRAQHWILAKADVDPELGTDILSDHLTLTDARAELRRILTAQETAR